MVNVSGVPGSAGLRTLPSGSSAPNSILGIFEAGRVAAQVVLARGVVNASPLPKSGSPVTGPHSGLI